MWQIKRDGVVLAWGPAESKPSPEELKKLRSDGHRVYVDGKEVKK